jgi:excinuclease ABC subunit A
MSSKNIVVKGAREHNLKNINVTIPRDKFVVITGLSGSGKSTLAFDTIYAEGQRRYVESLSAYARQFLGVMDKPDVDSIEGLSPAISIEQKTTSKNPRSTVGTVTEIYDYLRLLFARIGTPHCPKCNEIITGQVPDAIADALFSNHAGKRMVVCAPLIRHQKGTYEKLVSDLKQEGFVRARVDKTMISTDEVPKLDKYKYHDIEAVIDRLVIEDRSRIVEAIEHATKRSKGLVLFVDDSNHEYLFSTVGSCKNHPEVSFTDIQPRNFSFNSPFGACPTCHGLGIKIEFSPDLIMPDKNLSIRDNGIKCYSGLVDGWRKQQLASVGKSHGFSITAPLKTLTKQQMEVLLYGSQRKMKFSYESKDGGANFSHNGEWEGVIPQLQRLYRQTDSDRRREELQKFMVEVPCDGCEGKRLKPESLAVKINNKHIIDVTTLNITHAKAFLGNLKLKSQHEQIARPILKELSSRLGFLENVGLDYLNLSRSAGTLSGGEAQRIRLATQIGSNLMGVLYILDEPSIGLHQRDNQKLIDTLHHLRDLGNTLLVVEHDEDTMRASDWVIDMGPGAGVMGGRIVAEGTPQQLMKNKQSVTGQYLAGKLKIAVPKKRRSSDKYIELSGASEHNLKNVTARIPINTLTLITGVSGSGKSTLINQTLVPLLHNQLHGTTLATGAYKGLKIDRSVDKIIVVDQSPIGRTPRSNPATYTKIFDEVRLLFAATKEAKIRGYKEGRFSFNVPGGRCEACQGDGMLKIEMNFLPDVYVECETCKGRRYNGETLQIIYKGKNISEVLQMTVDEAAEFFTDIPSLARKLQTLQEVGLTYIKLGQPSTTLSGGEAQRIKLTRELAKRSMGHTVYVLDEPTTGLHFEDIQKLLGVLNRIVEKENTVIVIEHNLDVIKNGDWIIDLGPEGGDRGGTIIATGTPEDVAKVTKSYTGTFLKKVLNV